MPSKDAPAPTPATPSSWLIDGKTGRSWPTVILANGEDLADALGSAAAIAMTRATAVGRGPVSVDVETDLSWLG